MYYSHLDWVVLHGKCQELCENAIGSNQQRAGVCLEHSIYQSPSVRFLLFPENEQRHRKNACVLLETGLQFVLFHMYLHATSSCQRNNVFDGNQRNKE